MKFCKKCYNTQTKEIIISLYPCYYSPPKVQITVCSKCESTVFLYIPDEIKNERTNSN